MVAFAGNDDQFASHEVEKAHRAWGFQDADHLSSGHVPFLDAGLLVVGAGSPSARRDDHSDIPARQFEERPLQLSGWDVIDAGATILIGERQPFSVGAEMAPNHFPVAGMRAELASAGPVPEV